MIEAHFIKAPPVLSDYYDSPIPLQIPHIVIYTNYGEIYGDYELISERSAEEATQLIANFISLTEINRRS
ncbi:hypothetical protein HI914_00112 [Erysiphe necator]|nr:hypothetical protein HI914_00112 [Erysiphe necator]